VIFSSLPCLINFLLIKDSKDTIDIRTSIHDYYTTTRQSQKHHIMSTQYHSKEHEILATIRKVLSNVVRDTTPPPNRPPVLRPNTIEDLKNCFLLITSREKRIIEEAGGTAMDKRPRYADEPKTSQVVQFNNQKTRLMTGKV